jgi:hypothetical protein
MSKQPTWREVYAPKIAKIIEDNKGKDLKELKKILCAANEGAYGHHKKTWANEYMRQLGLSKKKSKIVIAKGQTNLF